MAVTKAQMAQWSRNYEGKYKDKKNEDSYHPAQTEPATKEQMNRWEENYQKKQNEANRVSSRMAQSRSGSGVRTAVESPLQTRVQLPQGSTDTRWMGGGTRQLGTLDSKKLADEVLDSVLGTPTGSPVKTDRQEDYEPDWNYASGDNTAQQRAQAANAVKRDDFDRWNLWMDADTRHRELVDLMRQKEQDYTSYAQQGTSARAPTAGAGGGAYTSYAQSGTSRSAGEEKETKAKYTDAQLRGMGYSQQEIDTARQYLTEYTAYNPAEVFVRRGADTAKGIAATVAAAPLLVGENLGVSIWNEMETRKNWKALREEVQGDTRQEKLLGMLTGGKTTYAQQGSTATSMQPYTDAELLEKGYTQAEIDTMHSRIAGTKVADSVDKGTLGYKLYDYGQRHTAAAQAGMPPAARTAMGVVSSAAENLAVAGVSPYLVLPVLSAQGAAESMGQSVKKGQSADRTLATGLAKFGAGWAINSVGAADLAKSMGVDYAKNTLAGQIADWVRGLGGDSAFAKAYPAVANALTGGVDNAVQAFVETYADTAIDAVLGGDTEAAEALLKPETFVTALQSGLTGGASGALGGAVGTGLGAMSAQIDYKAQQVQAQQQAAQLAQEYRAMEKRAMEPGESAAQAQRTAEQQVQREEAPSPLQSGDAGAATELPLGGSLSQRKDAAPVSDNAAVQQFEQMAQAQRLTGKTIRMFAPEAGNEANRAAFEAAYGVQLPDTAAATRRTLREVAAQRVQSEETEAQTAQQQAAEEALGEQSPLTVPASQSAAQERSSPEGESLSQRNVEKAGESVETVQPVQAGEADTTQSGALRETYGLRQQSLTEKQRSVQRELSRWKVSRGASETISRMVPDSITDLDRYTSAASCMYRLGQMEGVKTFDKALELAGSTSGLAGFTNYVLQQPGGKEALQAAWTQGQGETEAAGGLGGALGSQSTSGEGRVIWKGSLRTADEMATQLIQLNAAGTGTDAVLKSVLRGPDGTPSKRVKAYIDTETGRIFFADGNENVFATILHEDFHWYNALDAEGAKALMDMALEYMAESAGYEKVDSMIRDKMQDYAAQNLTYAQAAEELVAESWSGIFETVEDVTRWAQFQRAQADKNAGKAGTITKAVNAVKQMLNSIISKAKEILTIDPENRAALHAKNLAQAQKKALQDAYFAHAEKAMDNLRAAKENAAAIEGNGAAQGVRFQLAEGEETLEKQLNEHLKQLDRMEPVATITGNEVAYGATNKENAENIVRYFESIGGKVERDGFGVVELSRKGAKATVQHGNGPVKQIAAAAIPDVIRYGEQIGSTENWKGRGYNTHTFVAPVTVGGTTIYEAVIVNEYRSTKQGNKFYVHEVCGSDGSMLVLDNEGHIKQKQESADTVFKTEEGGERPGFPAKTSIAQDAGENKENNAAVQKTVRFALSAPVEVDGQKELVAVHNLTEQNLREALQLGGMPSPSIAVVKAREGHTKYGPVSLVFGSDTIDPMVDKANRVYGADAWTPTRPGVEYEVNYDAMRDFENRVYEASWEAFDGKFVNSAAVQRAGVDEASSLSREELAQKMQRDTGVQLAYLKDKGITVEPMYRMEQEQFDSIGNDALEAVIRHTGEAQLKEAFEGGDIDQLDKLADAAADALEEKYTHGALEGQNKRWMLRINKLRNENRGRLYQMLEHAYKMVTDTSAGKQTLDVEATRNAIREKAPEQKVEQWVYDKLEGVLGEKGIRNEKEPFTPSGKKQSFAQLHNPYTLENLVKAMNSQNARGQDVWGCIGKHPDEHDHGGV